MDSDDDPPAPARPTSTDPVPLDTPAESSSFLRFPVARRDASTLQTEANNIINSLPDVYSLDNIYISTSPVI